MWPAPRRTARANGWPAGRGPDPREETGSQALEFAMVLPLAAMLVVALVAAGSVAVAAVRVQALAGQLARVAAVAHDADVRRIVAPDIAGTVEVVIEPPSGSRVVGDVVTVELRHDLRVAGLRLPLTARGSALTESVP